MIYFWNLARLKIESAYCISKFININAMYVTPRLYLYSYGKMRLVLCNVNTIMITSRLHPNHKLRTDFFIVQDDEKELTEEERAQREQKAQSIRKMLSETQTTVTTNEAKEEKSPSGEGVASSSTLKAKVAAERKEREHLLALNQILARQVMEKSRVVAGTEQP